MSVAPIRYRKPAVLAGLPLDNHAVIEASAGTGKTYTLEHLYIELLLRGATVDQILVVTFTEKATAELRFRVRSKLEELVGAGPEADAGELPEGEAWLLDEVARGRLLQALQSFDGAVIATIHAFCQRVLTEHAFANRQLFTLEQVDRQEDGDLERAIGLMTRYDALADTLTRARHYGAMAKDALRLFAPSPMRDALTGIVDFSIDRAF